MVTELVGGSANQPPWSRHKRSFPSPTLKVGSQPIQSPWPHRKEAESAVKIVSGDIRSLLARLLVQENESSGTEWSVITVRGQLCSLDFTISSPEDVYLCPFALIWPPRRIFQPCVCVCIKIFKLTFAGGADESVSWNSKIDNVTKAWSGIWDRENDDEDDDGARQEECRASHREVCFYYYCYEFAINAAHTKATGIFVMHEIHCALLSLPAAVSNRIISHCVTLPCGTRSLEWSFLWNSFNSAGHPL